MVLVPIRLSLYDNLAKKKGLFRVKIKKLLTTSKKAKRLVRLSLGCFLWCFGVPPQNVVFIRFFKGSP